MYIPEKYAASITYVSSYVFLKDTPYYTQQCPDEWAPHPIYDLLKTGIQLCLYVSPDTEYDHIFRKWESEFPHFKVMAYRVEYTDTWIHKECAKRAHVDLPAHRNGDKDSYEYLVYNHAKAELLEDAISENPWNSSHFAWLDFNLAKLFKKPETLDWLGILGKRKYPPKLMAVPGCWDKYTDANVGSAATSIHWRFCGGFMMGDEESVLEFVAAYRRYFPAFLDEYATLPWEVNFWAWMEYKGYWSPDWYRGDHNDTMLYLSADMYTTALSPHINIRQKYSYENIPTYYPSSASYLYFNGLHLLNTRYVNYWMYPNGYYLFHNPKNVIENKNVLSILDPKTLIPVNYMEMQNVYLDKNGKHLEETPNGKPAFSEGLEDIRLYQNGGAIKFICTNVNYSPNGRNNMIVGVYDIEHRIFKDCMVVRSPNPDAVCEKNWIPLVNAKGEEWFIYRWYPLEIGQINGETHTLEIKRKYDVGVALFSKVRGSSTFVEWIDRDYLVGLVHFSEEHTPRHYYHMLVLLEKESFKVVKYTNTFCFEKLSIEFSVGMTIREDNYCFWISQFDRDPMFISVGIDTLPFVFLV